MHFFWNMFMAIQFAPLVFQFPLCCSKFPLTHRGLTQVMTWSSEPLQVSWESKSSCSTKAEQDTLECSAHNYRKVTSRHLAGQWQHLAHKWEAVKELWLALELVMALRQHAQRIPLLRMASYPTLICLRWIFLIGLQPNLKVTQRVLFIARQSLLLRTEVILSVIKVFPDVEIVMRSSSRLLRVGSRDICSNDDNQLSHLALEYCYFTEDVLVTKLLSRCTVNWTLARLQWWCAIQYSLLTKEISNNWMRVIWWEFKII